MSSNNNNNKLLSSSLPSNPSPRNSEISNPMRRSFTGNPFSKPSVVANPRTTFANTPSDFPKKSSVGIRESGGGYFVDDKENGKDQIFKPAKVRSPAVCSKATKNFMSPTISASFKVTESPRKKILTERNDPAPPTPSSDPKINARKVTFSDPLEQTRLEMDDVPIDHPDLLYDSSFENVPPEPDFVNLDPTPPTPSSDPKINAPKVTFSDPLEQKRLEMDDVPMDHPDLLFDSSFENVPPEPDFVNLDPTFKLSPPPAATPPISSMATVLDPSDDPLMPPYDPKTNYLSPRPQFLHYRPKPHIRLCDQRELEDSFLSGSSSETEFTEDTQSEESQKESEDEAVKQIEDQISEPNSLPKKTLEPKEMPKTRLSVRSKVIALILLLAVAFVSMSVISYPGIDQVFEDFYQAYESELPEFARENFGRFSQFAKANVGSLTQNLHIWFTKSLSSISDLVSNVRGAQNFAQLQYFNLTVLQDYNVDNQYPIFGHGEKAVGDYHPPVSVDEFFQDVSAEHYEVYEEQLEQDMGITTEVENAFDGLESEDSQPATLHLAEVENLDAMLAQEVDASFNVEDDNKKTEEILEGESSTGTEPEQGLQLIEAGTSEENQSPKDEDNSNVENELDLALENAEFHNEEGGESNVDTKQAQQSDAKLNDDDKVVGESASSEAVVGNGQLLETIQIPEGMLLYLLLCAGAVCIAGASFNRSRKVKSRSKKIIRSEEQQPKNDEFVLSEKNKQISPEKPSLRNGPVEMDLLGESCPSEMSSFEIASYSRKVVNEANSIDNKRRNSNNRRESLASSDYSIGSQSYGSLTVYQKIPKVRGEEEVITPVRRSSRIRRNLATSPA